MKNKSKILFVSLFLVIIILAIGGLVLAFLLNYNLYSPKKVEILDDGQNFYISTTMNDNYKLYRFIFTDDDGKEIVIDSYDNIISSDLIIEKGIEIGKGYKVQSQYLSENAGNNSKKSEAIYWVASDYLEAPEIVYDEDEESIIIKEIENANGYVLILQGLNNSYEIEINDLSFDVSRIEGDEYTATIYATSNNEGYLPSKLSNKLIFTYYNTYNDFYEINYDNDSKILSAKNLDNAKKISININGAIYYLEEFETTFNENESCYEYEIDLSIFQNVSSIGIKISSLDKYNKENNFNYIRVEVSV